MSQNREAGVAQAGPWVIDTRELGHRAGSSHEYHRRAPAPAQFGLDMIGVPEGEQVELELLAESVVEGEIGRASCRGRGEMSLGGRALEERVRIVVGV